MGCISESGVREDTGVLSSWAHQRGGNNELADVWASLICKWELWWDGGYIL